MVVNTPFFSWCVNHHIFKFRLLCAHKKNFEMAENTDRTTNQEKSQRLIEIDWNYHLFFIACSISHIESQIDSICDWLKVIDRNLCFVLTWFCSIQILILYRVSLNPTPKTHASRERGKQNPLFIIFTWQDNFLSAIFSKNPHMYQYGPSTHRGLVLNMANVEQEETRNQKCAELFWPWQTE